MDATAPQCHRGRPPAGPAQADPDAQARHRRRSSSASWRARSRLLLAYEVTRDLPTDHDADRHAARRDGRADARRQEALLVSILRAGDGLLRACSTWCPRRASVTSASTAIPRRLIAVEYYFKVPEDLQERLVIVVDPMLATGNSAVAAVSSIKEERRPADQVRLPAGRARRHRPVPQRPSRRADLHRGDRPAPQRPRLHHARPRRRRRSAVRDQVARRAAASRLRSLVERARGRARRRSGTKRSGGCAAVPGRRAQPRAQPARRGWRNAPSRTSGDGPGRWR